MYRRSLTELAAGLRAGDFSSVELTRACLDRIGRLDAALNCFVTVTEAQALEAAHAADARLAAGDAGPLTGIPFAHKDIFCTKGVKTSCGSRMLDNFVRALRRHSHAPPAGRRCGHARQDQHGRVRDGLVQRDQLLRAGEKPLGSRARAGRFLGRFGGRGRGAPGAGQHRHRHRRLHPPAGGAVRHHRSQADLRARVALRHDRVCLQSRPGRRVHAFGRGCRPAAGRHGRLRRTRFHQRRPAGGRLPRAAGCALAGPADRFAEGIFR